MKWINRVYPFRHTVFWRLQVTSQHCFFISSRDLQSKELNAFNGILSDALCVQCCFEGFKWSQIFSMLVSQNTVELVCKSTTKIHDHLGILMK